MALKIATKQIGGVDYTISQLSATRSVKLLARLGRVLGPALGHVAKLVGDVDPSKPFHDQEIDESKLSHAGGVIQALFATLDDAEIDGLLRELFTNVAATGAPAEGVDFLGPFEGDLKKIDRHFAGRVDDLFRVAFASIEVNYGGFFGVVAALVPKRKGPTAKAPDSATSSI